MAMNESQRLVASSVMPKAMAVLLVSILVANAIQHWLVLPFEGLRSPHEVLGPIVGLFLFLTASLLTAVQPVRGLLPAVSGLFLVLILGDVVLDAVSPQKFDTVVSFLWLVPGLLMTWSPSTSKCAYARAFF